MTKKTCPFCKGKGLRTYRVKHGRIDIVVCQNCQGDGEYLPVHIYLDVQKHGFFHDGSGTIVGEGCIPQSFVAVGADGKIIAMSPCVWADRFKATQRDMNVLATAMKEQIGETYRSLR